MGLIFFEYRKITPFFADKIPPNRQEAPAAAQFVQTQGPKKAGNHDGNKYREKNIRKI